MEKAAGRKKGGQLGSPWIGLRRQWQKRSKNNRKKTTGRRTTTTGGEACGVFAAAATTVNRLRWLGYLYHVTNHLIQPGVERSRDVFPASNFNCLLTISKVGTRNSDCIVVSFSFWSDFFSDMAS